jgi:hypothetical protein
MATPAERFRVGTSIQPPVDEPELPPPVERLRLVSDRGGDLAVIFRPRLQAVDDASTVPQRELELLASVHITPEGGGWLDAEFSRPIVIGVESRPGSA